MSSGVPNLMADLGPAAPPPPCIVGVEAPYHGLMRNNSVRSIDGRQLHGVQGLQQEELWRMQTQEEFTLKDPKAQQRGRSPIPKVVAVYPNPFPVQRSQSPVAVPVEQKIRMDAGNVPCIREAPVPLQFRQPFPSPQRRRVPCLHAVPTPLRQAAGVARHITPCTPKRENVDVAQVATSTFLVSQPNTQPAVASAKYFETQDQANMVPMTTVPLQVSPHSSQASLMSAKGSHVGVPMVQGSLGVPITTQVSGTASHVPIIGDTKSPYGTNSQVPTMTLQPALIPSARGQATAQDPSLQTTWRTTDVGTEATHRAEVDNEHSWKNQCTRANEEKDKLETELQVTKSSLKKIQEDKVQAELKANSDKSLLERRVERAEREEKHAREAGRNLEGANRELQAQLEESTRQSHQLQSKNRYLEEQVEHLKERSEAAEKKTCTIEKENCDLKQESYSLKQENCDLKQESYSLKQDRRSIEQRIQEQQIVMESLKSEMRKDQISKSFMTPGEFFRVHQQHREEFGDDFAKLSEITNQNHQLHHENHRLRQEIQILRHHVPLSAMPTVENELVARSKEPAPEPTV